MDLERYLEVKTGQDLIDLGVKPKSSSETLAVIIFNRLKALREHIAATVKPEMLGAWLPLADKKEIRVSELTDPREIHRYTKENLRVAAKTGTVKGLEGKIIAYDNRALAVVFDTAFDGGNNLEGRCEKGHGAYIGYNDVRLLSDEVAGIEVKLRPRVVVDKTNGHRIKIQKSFKVPGNDFEYQEGLLGRLTEYDAKNNVITISFDQPVYRTTKNIQFSLEQVYSYLNVSSLGAKDPLKEEDTIKDEVLANFFPTTALEAERTERVLLALVMCKDVIFYGPPGGGKSNLARDIIKLAQLQSMIFEVDNPKCRANCNPYSVFDPEFAEQIQPCPDCKQHYDPNFKKTGRFHRPKPKDVKVVPARYGSGNGIVYVEGTSAQTRTHLAGYAIPKMTGIIDAITSIGGGILEILADKFGYKGKFNLNLKNEDDQEFHPGTLILSHNGILHIDELDKLRPTTLDEFLEALLTRVQPEGLSYPYPSDQLIAGTANDISRFSEPLIDRMNALAVRYPDDLETSYLITRRGYYKEQVDLEEMGVTDPHQLPKLELRKIVIPTVLDQAIDQFYINFRKGYRGAGNSQILGSIRSKFDAMDAARGQLLFDQIFFKETGEIVTPEYVVKGIQYALCSRVQEANEKQGQEIKTEIRTWVEEQFPAIMKEVEETWWCRMYRRVDVYAPTIPEIQNNLVVEMSKYTEDPRQALEAYRQVKLAEDQPTVKHALAKVQFPLMDYLFTEQPGFKEIDESSLVPLIDYLMKSAAQQTACKLQ